MLTFEFTLPIELMSLNRWQKLAWYQRRDFKRRIVDAIENNEHVPVYFVEMRAKLTITQVRRQRFKDIDNMYASLKPLLDALEYTRVIVEDSMRWIDVEVFQETLRGREPHVMVRVEYQDE